MNTVIVTEYARPWPGGISEHVHHEAAHLRGRGHNVTVLTGPGPETEGVVRLRHAVRFGSNGAANRLSFDRRLLGLRRLFKQADVLHVHAPLDPALSVLATLASPVPVVGTFHANFDPGPQATLQFGVFAPVMRRAWSRLHTRIAVSPAARDAVGRYLTGSTVCIPNGVDTDRFTPDAPPRERSGGPVVLFVGRNDPRKGLPMLRQAFAEHVRVAHPNAELWVAGCTVEARPGETILGEVAPADLPGLFTGADVFCAPSLRGESQGIVLLESMAAGRAPVAFDIPGYRDVVSHGRDGVLVPELSAACLGSALVEHIADEERRRHMGETARQSAMAYSWHRIGDRIATVLETAAGLRAVA